MLEVPVIHWAKRERAVVGRKAAGFGNPYTPEVGVTRTFNHFKHSSVPKGVELRSTQGYLIISDYIEYRIGPERDRLKHWQPKTTA